ncbi:MAG TPA: ABC transporter permease [Terracidiphilus sp.]|nr:ABC transporter permease [Terracidiphilus sp.]
MSLRSFTTRMVCQSRSWFRGVFHRARLEREMDDELGCHLEILTNELIRSGLSPVKAARRARIALGSTLVHKEEMRASLGLRWWDALWADLRYGVRMLRRSPGFTAVVVLTLALGIGANTAIFSLVNAVMLRSLPVRDPQQLVMPAWTAHNWPNGPGISSYGDCRPEKTSQDRGGCSFSYPMYQAIATHKDLFESAMAFAGPASIDVSGNGTASIAHGELVSGSYFGTLGVQPAVGRILEPDDEKPGAAAVAVLDYGYWKQAFGGSPSVVGRTIRLNDVLFTIVGVADAGFTRLTPGKAIDLWVPLTEIRQLGIPWGGHGADNGWWLAVVARLRPEISRTRAQAALNALFVNEALHGAKPAWKATDDPHLMLLPAEKELMGFRSHYGKPLMLLLGAVGIVLLIACANVAGLMLARGAARGREMAVRMAMGAGRRRVIRQLLTESLLLSFVGAALGAVLAYAGASGLAAFFAHNSFEPLRINLHPDARVLLFTIGVAVLTGIGFGLAPALRGARANMSAELKGTSATTTLRRRGRRFGLGSGLVAAQVALSMVVLMGAGLLLRTLDRLHSINPGFDTKNLLLFSIAPELAGYPKDGIPQLYAQLQRRLEALSGVVSVSYSSDAILDGGLWSGGVDIDGQASKRVHTQILSVGPDYFHTMRIPLEMGRALGSADMAPTERAAVVNQAFAREYLGGRDPLGVHIGDPNTPQWMIVGVVGNTKYLDLRSADAPTVFFPLTKGGATFEVRTATTPAAFGAAVRKVVNDLDDAVPVMQMRTQTESVDHLLFSERLVARLFGLFGGLGLALAGIGLYGLLSYEVARRTREIGIRTALGAQRRAVWVMVVREGLGLVIVGVAAGCGVALCVTRLLKSLLYDVRPTDPATMAAVATLLLIVGVIACSAPAQRALRVDPMTALRCE